MFYQFNHLGSPDYVKIESGNDFNFPPHLHQCFEIIIIKSGEMKITVNSNKYILKENDALLIFPNQIHSLESENSEHILCIFSPQMVNSFSSKIADKMPKSNKFTVDSYIINSLKNIDTYSHIEKKGVLYLICGMFDRIAEYKDSERDKENLILKCFAFVEKHFADNCSLSDLSKETGYNYSYLSRFFKKIVGISFNGYVNHYRLSRACYLLDNSPLSILQCTYECGFVSLRSFNRNFKAQFGISPTEYRKNKSLY